MHRTDANGNVANLFSDGDPELGLQATVVDAAWLNAVQEEIVNMILTKANVTLVKGTNTQLGSALDKLYETAGVVPGGRLTLASGVPVTVLDQVSATSVLYTPYKHDRIQLYDGTRWLWYTFTELSQTASDATKSPAAVANNSNYDVFVWNDAGTLRATRGPAWTSDVGRGSGATTTELEVFSGRYVNKQAITNGPAARRGLYVGTVRSDGSAQFNDTFAKRLVWNTHNRVPRAMRVTEPADSWAYAVNAWRQMNNNTANQLDMVRGLDEDPAFAQVCAFVSNSVSAAGAAAGIGLDTVGAITTGFITTATGTQVVNVNCVVGGLWRGYPGLGRHYLAALENPLGNAGTTWYGDNGVASRAQAGIDGQVMA